MFFFFTRETTYFFSHLVSWHLMIRSLIRFKPLYWYQPWIYPSQHPSCWLCFHPAGFGWQFSQERPDALGKCRTTLSVITVNLESLDDFFPRTSPRSTNWNMAEHGWIFFIGKKLILDCQSPTNSRTKYRTKLPNHEKSIGIFGFKSCRMKILGSVPKKYQKPIFKPY